MSLTDKVVESVKKFSKGVYNRRGAIGQVAVGATKIGLSLKLMQTFPEAAKPETLAVWPLFLGNIYLTATGICDILIDGAPRMYCKYVPAFFPLAVQYASPDKFHTSDTKLYDMLRTKFSSNKSKTLKN